MIFFCNTDFFFSTNAFVSRNFIVCSKVSTNLDHFKNKMVITMIKCNPFTHTFTKAQKIHQHTISYD